MKFQNELNKIFGNKNIEVIKIIDGVCHRCTAAIKMFDVISLNEEKSYRGFSCNFCGETNFSERKFIYLLDFLFRPTKSKGYGVKFEEDR